MSQHDFLDFMRELAACLGVLALAGLFLWLCSRIDW